MRVIWKDTGKDLLTRHYRGYQVYGASIGWTTTLPDDNNVYKSWTDGLNAIDEYLGGTSQLGPARKRQKTIRILCTLNEQQSKKEEGLSI